MKWCGKCTSLERHAMRDQGILIMEKVKETYNIHRDYKVKYAQRMILHGTIYKAR